MIEQQTLLIIISIIFTAGSVYGVLNHRIKVVEDRFSDHKDVIERLTRLESSVNLLVAKFLKDETAVR
jgi:hypothetical protein